MENRIYQLKKGVRCSSLGKYGFYKTQPKDNPWYQYPIHIDWNGGLGIWHEIININKETHEVIVECDYEQWSNNLQNKFNKLVDEKIIEVQSI